MSNSPLPAETPSSPSSSTPSFCWAPSLSFPSCSTFESEQALSARSWNSVGYFYIIYKCKDWIGKIIFHFWNNTSHHSFGNFSRCLSADKTLDSYIFVGDNFYGLPDFLAFCVNNGLELHFIHSWGCKCVVKGSPMKSKKTEPIQILYFVTVSQVRVQIHVFGWYQNKLAYIYTVKHWIFTTYLKINWCFI